MKFFSNEEFDKMFREIVSAEFICYLKKAKRYYKQKNKLENETFDEEVKDEIWQRTCPKCGKTHDIDYPKCPYCKFDYNNNNKQ